MFDGRFDACRRNKQIGFHLQHSFMPDHIGCLAAQAQQMTVTGCIVTKVERGTETLCIGRLQTELRPATLAAEVAHQTTHRGVYPLLLEVVTHYFQSHWFVVVTALSREQHVGQTARA